VEVWLEEVGYDVNAGGQELYQLVITSDLQPNPVQKCFGTERKLVPNCNKFPSAIGFRKRNTR
jgi:hypothetical protein